MAPAALYIYWGEESPASFRWHYFQDGIMTHSGASTLELLADKYGGVRATLLVPTEDLLITSVAIPTGNRQKLRQAIPYALEEQLIDDVDEFHYAIGPLDSDGVQYVAAVKRDKMVEWLAPFDDAGLRITTCLPDVFALPLSEKGWTLLVEERRALLRTTPQQGYALPVKGLADLINAELATRDDGEGSVPQKLDLIDCRSDEEQSSDNQIGEAQLKCDVTLISCSKGLDALTQRGQGSVPPFNLLQGEFSRKDQLWRILKPWRAAVALVAVALLLSVVGWVVEYRRLIDQEQGLQSAIEEVYRKSFPNARKIINPRLQMEQKLAKLQKGGSKAEFSQLMVAAIPVLLKVDGVKVDVLRYKQQSLEMELRLKDLPSIDRLKELMEGAGFKFKVQNASSSAGQVTGRVTLSRQKS